jgi:hypothetical protein
MKYNGDLLRSFNVWEAFTRTLVSHTIPYGQRIPAVVSLVVKSVFMHNVNVKRFVELEKTPDELVQHGC